MKNLKIVIAALLLMTVLVGIGIVSAAPPPPVPQEIGFVDTQFPNVTVTACRGCHGGQPTLLIKYPAQSIHHAMVGKGTTTLGCTDCHPQVESPAGSGRYSMYVEPNCKNCHNGTGWYMNSFINLTVIRGQPGRPHHNTTKNSASNLALPAAYMAADRNCRGCHGDSYLDNYNDGHEIKNLVPQEVSVFADFKINGSVTTDGSEWGGCAACHDANASANPIINSNYGTHHYETTSMLGRQCNYCHVGNAPRAEPVPDRSPDPNSYPLRIWFNDTNTLYKDTYGNLFADIYGWDTSVRHIEVTNWSMLSAGDTVNGTGCVKCHSYRDLHSIEDKGPNPSAQYNIDNGISGYGHIGGNNDCYGCHAFWAVSDGFTPPQQLATSIDDVTPGSIVAGTATEITVVGRNFDQSANGYVTSLLLDGVPLATASITDGQIVATVPGTTTAGIHNIQVDVSGIKGSVSTLSVAAPVTIDSAVSANGVLTITGSGFGSDNMGSVVVTKADGSQALAVTTSWADNQIVVNSDAVAGDTVQVVVGDGSATATITGGVVAPTLTVTSPNGGESWKRGTAKTITWSTTGVTGPTVDIVAKNINSKGKTVTTTIATGVTNSGSYSWNIPRTQTLDNDYKITVTSSGGQPDTSDGNFAIVK